MKYCKMVAISLIVFLVVSSCGVRTKMNAQFEENKPEKLLVYAVGDQVLVNYEDQFFTTRYLLGEFDSMAEKWGEEGYIFYDAIEKFEKEMDIDIEIVFFKNTQELLKSLVDSNNTKPDIIIGSYSSREYCLYPYMADGVFADLKAYFEEDEIYSSGEYISEVLEAGLIGNQQLIFPLTFNMNVLFSSKESLKRHDFLLSNDMTYEELMKMFTEEWRKQGRNEDEILMMQYTNMWNDFPYVLFQAASGESLIDYETGEILLDDEYFYDLAKLYESYLCNDYNMTREDLKILANQNQGYLSGDLSAYNNFLIDVTENSLALDIFDLIYEKIGCFAEGGNSSYLLHSFAAQAYYYDSRYRDVDEELIFIGIPSKGENGEYTAQVTTFGAVTANSLYPQYGYYFLKALADYSHFMCFDLSVNRSVTIDTINQMASTYYDLYPSLGSFPPEKEPEGEDWLGEPYSIAPLSETTKSYLLEMIDNIGIAKLPEWGLNRIITQEIEEYIFGETNSVEEAYQRVTQQLNTINLN